MSRWWICLCFLPGCFDEPDPTGSGPVAESDDDDGSESGSTGGAVSTSTSEASTTSVPITSATDSMSSTNGVTGDPPGTGGATSTGGDTEDRAESSSGEGTGGAMGPCSDGSDVDCVSGCEGRSFEGRAYVFCGNQETMGVARESCQSMGQDLVRIESSSENAFVHTQVGAVFGSPGWIGANDIAAEGEWVWLDETTPFFPSADKDAPFERWADTEPNNFGGNENCAVILAISVDWADVSCAQTEPYVCEQL